jgi:outer membrane protein TolC
VSSPSHNAALEVELVYARAALARAEARIKNIEAELRRARGGAPETATVEAPEQAVPPKPRRS